MKMKRYARSMALYGRALAMYRKTGGADHPDVAQSLAGLGEAHLLSGKPRRALPMLERAVALYSVAEGRTAESASARYLLAQALWATRRSDPRAASGRVGARRLRAGRRRGGGGQGRLLARAPQAPPATPRR